MVRLTTFFKPTNEDKPHLIVEHTINKVIFKTVFNLGKYHPIFRGEVLPSLPTI